MIPKLKSELFSRIKSLFSFDSKSFCFSILVSLFLLISLTSFAQPGASISGTVTVCEDATYPEIRFTGFSGIVPYVFTYTINGGLEQTISTTLSDTFAIIAVPTEITGTFIYELVSVSDPNDTTLLTGSATITVVPDPVISVNPVTPLPVCVGGTLSPLSITATGGTHILTYQWYSNTTNSTSGGTLIPAATASTYTPPATTAGTLYYYCIVSATGSGCGDVASTTALVRINPLPTASITGATTVCKDASFPNITFTGANGTAPYTFTYRINTGGSQTITTTVGNSVTLPVPTGVSGNYNYILQSVRDDISTNCSQSQTGNALVVINPLPTATITGTVAVCKDAPSPTITFSGANGTSPYTFTYTVNSGSPQIISSSVNTATLSVPTNNAGTFTYSLVSVTDASLTSCSQAQGGSATVTVNPLPTAIISGTTIVCRDSPSPNITFTGANGTAPYTFTYRLNTGGNQTISSSGSNNSVSLPVPTSITGVFTYTLISVQDASSTSCNQSQTGSAVVTVNPLPTAVITGTTEVCKDGLYPDVTFTGANATPPYTFTYSINSGSNQTITTTLTNSATLSVPTGTAGIFTYSLLSVKDASTTGCSQTQASSATIRINPLPAATITGTTAVCRNAPSPEIVFTGSNGTRPYTFRYRINGGSIQTATSLLASNNAIIEVPTTTAGSFTYSLISVSDGTATACEQAQSGSAIITINPLPSASISGTADVCRNATPPLITFTGTNATTPYTFSYNINGGSTQTIQTISGNTVSLTAPTASAGIFTYNLLSVQDASSTTCNISQSGSAVINVNALPTTSVITGTPTPPCSAFGVPYSVVLTSGSSYAWTAPNGATITSGATGPDNNAIIVNFGELNGNISVTETFPTGCSGTTVIRPISLAGCNLNANFSASSTSVCSGSAITFTSLSTGITAGTTYSWNFGTGAFPATAIGIGPHNVTYTGSGTRTVNLTIQDGATDSETKVNYIQVNPLPSGTISGSIAVCKDAASPLITFTGSNGTPPYTYTYNINSGANQTVASSGNSVTVPAATSSAGLFTYSLVSIRDASSSACLQAQTGNAVITVNPLPIASISGSASVCRGATSPIVTFTGENGLAPYTFFYTINGGSIQSIVSSGSTATLAAPTLTAGTYTYTLVSAQDASSTACSQSQTGSIIIRINQLPSATISGTTAVCRNASSPNITFTGADGVPPYTFTYTINGGVAQTISTTVGNSVTAGVPTTTAGSFRYDLISVQDASSSACIQAQSGIAIVTVNPLPTALISGTTDVCKDAPFPSVTFTGAAGTLPYTFTYNVNGGNSQTVTTSSGNSTTVTVPTGVAGTYTYNLISVKDGSSTTCSQPQSGTAVVTVNSLPSATISGTTSVCRNAVSPLITFAGSNGNPPYTFTYTINSGNLLTVTTSGSNIATVTVPTTSAGNFTYALVSVEDASSTSCSQTQSGGATVIVNPLPTATISGTTAVCKDGGSPVITFTGANGTSPYTFNYVINGGSVQTVTTVAGNNSVTVSVPTSTAGVFNYALQSVRDASSTTCLQSQSGNAIITINPLPTATISGSTSVCKDSPSPVITLTGTNGTAPYTFSYTINSGPVLTTTSDAGGIASISVPTGTVSTFTYALVSVRDGSSTSCSQTQSGSATVIINPLPTATVGGTTAVCQGGASPLIIFTGANGTEPYTFTYRINTGSTQTIASSPGSSASVAVPTTSPGTFTYYLLSVRDASSTACVQTQTGNAVVTVNPLPIATISGTTSVCKDATFPNITFTGANGTSPYVFTYTIDGGSNQTVTSTGNTATVPVPTGTTGTFTYTLVSVRDGSSTACIQPQSGSAIVTVNPLPTATITGAAVVCRNAASPNILFTGANGTAPYTFTYRINTGAPQTITTTALNTVTLPASTTTAGTFTYSLISVSDMSSSTCVQNQTGSTVITVNPLPTATISGTTSVCRNASSPLITFTGASGTAPYTFTYNINGGLSQTIQSPTGTSVTIAVPTENTGTFTYNLLSVRDASSTACVQNQSGSAIVTVTPLPVTSVISGNQTPACGASAISYSVTLTSGSSYAWTVPAGAVITSGATGPNNNSIIVNFGSNNGNISVVESLPTGCSGAPISLAISLQGCALNAEFSANSTSVCSGSSITFTDLSTGVSGSTDYSWNFGTSATPGTATGVGPHTVSYTGSGTRNVSLTISEGASNTETKLNYIRVNPLPTATVSGTVSVCKDAASPLITFTGSSGTAPYTFTYRINTGTIQTVTSTGNSATVAASTSSAGTFSYNLLSVQDASSSACIQAQTGSAVVTVNPLPTATIGGTATVCRGENSPLIVFTGNNGTAPYTFTYRINTGGNQTISTTGVSNTVSLSAPTNTTGTFAYNLLSVKDGSSTGCAQSQTGSATIIVNPLPTATISGTTAVCKDASSPNITFTGANGTARYTFSYMVNGGPVQTAVTTVGNTVTVAAPTTTVGSLYYILLGVQDESITACAQSQTGNATITINPLPTATISGTTSVCKDAATPFITFTGANGTSPYTFTFNVNGGNSQSISTAAGNNSITLAAPTGTAGTFTYNLTSVRDASITTCSQAQAGNAVVTVNPLPVANMSGSSTVCRNSAPPIITFTGSNGTAPYTFRYTINSGTVRTVTSGINGIATVAAPTAGVGTFTYALESVQDASSTACIQSQGGTVTIIVNPLPTATITGATSVCLGGISPVITLTGANGTEPYTFTYRINSETNQSVSTSGSNTLTLNAPTSEVGNFSYNLISIRDASASACLNSQTGSALIRVNPLPTASISGTTEVCQQSTPPVITFTGANGTSPYTFTYSINGAASQTVTSTDNTASVSTPTGTVGSFTYELLSVRDASSTACTQLQSGNAIVTVNPLPTATISGTTSVCNNDPSPVITFTGANGTEPYTFIYRINGGSARTVSTLSGNSVQVEAPTSLSGNFVYSLISVTDGSSTACLQNQSGNATVTVYEIPDANAGPGGYSCDLTFGLNAVTSVGTGIWTKSSGPGDVTFLPDLSSPDATAVVTETGNYTFKWTELNVLCSDSSLVVVDYYELPVPDPGSGGNECDLDFVLNAVPGLGVGTWSLTSGPGDASFVPDSNTATAVVSVTENGEYTFTWTEVNVSCSNSADIIVNFYQQPNSDAGTGGNFCGLEAELNSIPDIGSGTWSMSSGPGSILFAPQPDLASVTATASLFGDYLLMWKEVNGTCSDSASILVSFIDSPIAIAGTGSDECDLNYGLNAVPSIGNAFWSKLSGDGNVIFSPENTDPKALVTVDQYGSYEFEWTVENIACTSTDQITVVFHELPIVWAGQDTTICKGSEIQLRGQGDGFFYWTPDSAVSDSSVAEPFTTPDSSTIFKLTLTDQFGCQNSDEVEIIVRDSTIAHAGPDQVLEYAFNTSLSAYLDHEYERGVWSLFAGGAEVEDTLSPVTGISVLSLGLNTLLWTVSNEVCPASIDSVNILVNDLKNPTIFTPNQDGINDYFVIQGLPALGKTELIVFDRRGAIVYENPDYNNDWNGVDYKGNQLIDGTYYYVLNAENGKAVSGFIVLRR